MTTDPFDIKTTGTLTGRLRPLFEAAIPAAHGSRVDEVAAALAAERLFAVEPHRAINASLLEDDTWYVVKQSDFDWLTWAMTLVGGPLGVIKQLRMLARYRKRRVQLNTPQAQVLLALRELPRMTASSAILASALGPKYGLDEGRIEAILADLAVARRADGAPADIIVRDGDAWRAIDL